MKKKILIIALCFVAVIGSLCAVFFNNDELNNSIDTIENVIVNEIEQEDVVVSNEVIEEAENTINAVENNEELKTVETIEEVDENEIEKDATVEQENIAYNGSNDGDGLELLGAYEGLTYYNQGDSRWANKMYSSIGDKSQTMKSSGCGPTAAAIVVSSSKGTILPTTMANLFVDNGYRTAGSGTAWAAFSFTADYFGFDEYHSTGNYNTAMNYLKKKENNGASKYYAVVSCGSGLFTTGGHYIVIMSLDDDTLKIYDPYLYSGKFNTASRKKANVRVSGNNVYVSKSNFKKYANVKNYFIFSNDQGSGNTSSSSSKKYTRYVDVNTSLNVRKGPGMNYSIVDSLRDGETVTVYETKSGWSRIGSSRWVSSEYLTSKKSSSSTSSSYSTTVGAYYRLKNRTTLYSKSNLTGTKYTYLPQTQIKVVRHASSTVDYIYVVKTGRYAYCKTSAFSSSSSSNSGTVGKVKTLKNNCYLYSKSNLSGTRYAYLKNTTVTVLKNVSSSVDYVQVRMTGRKAYINTNNYK